MSTHAAHKVETPSDAGRTRLTSVDFKEQDAVQTIVQLGGRIKTYTAQFGSKVTDVSLFGTPITDEDLKSLRYLSGLQALYLHNTSISDMGLKHLKELSNLRLLVLGDRITDEGLKQIMQMHQLTYVCVISKMLSLAAIEQLRLALPHCEVDI
jgi:hypothetical protein